MPVHPDDVDAIADRVTALYREAELSLVATIKTHLDKGWESPGWAEERLAAVRVLRRAARAIVADLSADASSEIRAGLAEAYRRGGAAAIADLPASWHRLSGVGTAARAALREVTQHGAVESLAAALVRDIGERSSNIVRAVVDVYRAVVAAATTQILVAGQTRRQAAQAAWQGFMDRGVSSFTDVSGRRWQLSSYVEMATRTVTQRAAVQGQTDRLETLGVDLVYVSNSPQECALCRPYEGRVLRRGDGPVGLLHVADQLGRGTVEVSVVATLDEARLLGLFHPNCRHSVSAYLPGVTRVPAGPTADPEGDVARQRQREIERHIRAWKVREVGAVDPDAAAAARRKVRAWQGSLRDHLAANPGLKRLRYREQIGAGNIAKGAHPAGSIESQAQETLDGGPAGPAHRHPPTGVKPPADVVAEQQAELHGQGSLDEALAAQADPLHGVELAALDDDQLADLFAELSGREDTTDDAFAAVLDEMGRRDDAAKTAGPGDAFDLPEETTETRRIDELVARGYDYVEAYAEVYGKSVEQLRREERAGLVERRAGETIDQAVRRAYDEWVHLQYLAAEEYARGHVLSAAGEAAGIDAIDLFSGPVARARKYASEELLRYWADNPRMTFTQFKADVLGRAADVAAAERTRLSGNDRDFI